jgi:hypothetical protein
MSKKPPPIDTVPYGDGSVNRREGSGRVSNTFDTKAEAQAAGRETAAREATEHLIQQGRPDQPSQQLRQRPLPSPIRVSQPRTTMSGPRPDIEGAHRLEMSRSRALQQGAPIDCGLSGALTRSKCQPL